MTASGDTLTVQVGPKGLNAPLTHYDGDVFSWLAPGGNGDPVSAVTFGGGAGARRRRSRSKYLMPTAWARSPAPADLTCSEAARPTTGRATGPGRAG